MDITDMVLTYIPSNPAPIVHTALHNRAPWPVKHSSLHPPSGQRLNLDPIEPALLPYLSPAPPTRANTAHTAIMSYNVLMQLYRKEGTTPEHFKAYYETTHVPVIQRLSGDLFPTSHSRHYIAYVPQATSTPTMSHPAPGTEADATGGRGGGGDQRVKAAAKLLSGSVSAGDSVPMVVQGQPKDFGWDVCTVLRFGSAKHFQAFMAVLMDEENAKVLAEDEEKFMDRSKFKCVILGETLTTLNERWEEALEKSE